LSWLRRERPVLPGWLWLGGGCGSETTSTRRSSRRTPLRCFMIWTMQWSRFSSGPWSAF